MVSTDTLAGNEMHILKLSNVESHGTQYKCVPALSVDNAYPGMRAGHTACVIDKKIVVFGGYDSHDKKEPLEERGRVWLFDPTTFEWSHLDPINERYPQCHSHAAVASGTKLFIHGGVSVGGSPNTSNTWAFDLSARTWIELPTVTDADGSAPLPSTSLPNLAIAHEKLYLISSSSKLDGHIHVLNIAPEASEEWTTIDYPTNPLTPGPQSRYAAGLHQIFTGYGRTYLLLMFGSKDQPNDEGRNKTKPPEFWSDIWTLQLPSTSKTPAQAKDVTRESMGVESGEAKWAEVEIVPRQAADVADGKSHPGPRAYFGSAAVDDKKVLMWGGLNARGEPEGDGWTIQLKF